MSPLKSSILSISCLAIGFFIGMWSFDTRGIEEAAIYLAAESYRAGCVEGRHLLSPDDSAWELCTNLAIGHLETLQEIGESFEEARSQTPRLRK